MSYELCEKVKSLEPYEPISGDYKVRLDANESFFNMPQSIKDEIAEMMKTLDYNRYPDPAASKLIAAFADYYQIDPQNVTATNGSDEMLYLLASAMLQKNSKVVVVEPDFSMYRFYSFLSENQIITVNKSDTLNISVDALIDAAQSNNADMIIFSNPCNPTGLGVTADEARRLVRSVRALLVLDEAYMDFWDQGLLREAADYENLIVLKTASKAVGAAAVRLGFAVANKTITRALRAVKSPYNVNTVSQEIGTIIYRNTELLRQRREEIVANTNALYQALRKLCENYKLEADIVEPCANFVFVRTARAQDIFNYLLNSGIAVRYFGGASALRITAGAKDENDALLSCMERYIIEKIVH